MERKPGDEEQVCSAARSQQANRVPKKEKEKEETGRERKEKDTTNPTQTSKQKIKNNTKLIKPADEYNMVTYSSVFFVRLHRGHSSDIQNEKHGLSFWGENP